MVNLCIKDIEIYLPENVITNDFFGEELLRTKNKMFLGTKERRHIGRDDKASDHMHICAQRIIENNNLNVKDIDMIVTNVSCPDEVFTGSGAVLNKRINGNARHILDIHNTGCVSFIYMLDLVKTYMIVHNVKSALVCNSQTAAGRVFA